MKAANTTYHKANKLDDAVAIAKGVDGMPKYMAGGQSLLPMMNLRLAMPDAVIDISGIPALRESRRETGPDGGKLFIGAGVTHAMIEDGKVEDPAQGYLRNVAGRIAYRSVRNKGTIGGSLVHADPAADWPAALLALGAVAVLQGDEGARDVPLAQFQIGLMETCLGETEILQGVLLPVLSTQARWSYNKFCRKVGEFAHSIGAVVIDPQLKMANAVLGAAADKPFVLPRVSERLALGLTADDAAGQAFAALVEQDIAEATVHEPSSYDFHLHKTIITRAVLEALKK
jgi:carbon-monoxide dehydrogenase medium subunit